MSSHEASNQSGQLMSNNEESRRASRRTAIDIFFEEEPMFSDSEDEEEFKHRTSLHIACLSVKKTTGEKSMLKNNELNQQTNLLIDQLLMLCCDYCTCCKKIKDFLEFFSKTELSTRSPSLSSYDSGLGPPDSHHRTKILVSEQVNPSEKIKIISCETFTPSESSMKLDNLGLPNVAGNGTVQTVDKSTNETVDDIGLLSERNKIQKTKSRLSFKDKSAVDLQLKDKIIEATNQKLNFNSDNPDSTKENMDYDKSLENNGPMLVKKKQRGRPRKSVLNLIVDNSSDLNCQPGPCAGLGSSPDSRKENVGYEMTLEHEKPVSAEKKRKGRPINGGLNLMMSDSSDIDQKCQPGSSAGSPDLQTENRACNKSLENEIPPPVEKKRRGRPRRSLLPAVISQKANVEHGKNLETKGPVLAEKKQTIRKSVLNLSVSESSDNDQPKPSVDLQKENEACDKSLENEILALVEKKHRGKPRNSLETSVILQKENIEFEKSLETERPVSAKIHQKGRPKKSVLNFSVSDSSDDDYQPNPAMAYHDLQSDKSDNGVEDDHPKTFMKPPKRKCKILSETDPYDLKYKTKLKQRSKRSDIKNSDYHQVRKPLFNVSIDTTSNRSVSKAFARKLGRTAGFYNKDYLNSTDGISRSFSTRKTRTLYSSDEWLNSAEFLKLSGDEY